MNAGPLRVDRAGDRLTLTLNRPGAGNTVDLDLAHALVAALASDSAAGARVVVIRGEGKVFCGGGDVNAMARAEDAAAYLTELTSVFHEFLLALMRLPAPVIAAVDGAAAGAGLGICLASDVVVATERARFLSAFSSVGLSPDSGVSFHLPRVVGEQRALDLTLTGRVLDAETARDWGIVARVVDAGDLDAEIDALSAALAGVPGDALGETKRLVRARSVDAATHLAEESQTMAQVARHHDVVARIDDFARKAREKAQRDGAAQ